MLLYAHFIKPRCNVDIATRMSRSMSMLLRYFDLITTTADKPASHKYVYTNMLQMAQEHGELYSLHVEI